jgi:hypothetical protein
VNERNPLDVARQPVVSRREVVATDHREVSAPTPMGRERA